MAFDYTIKQGDSNPALTDTLTLSDGTVPNYAGAAVQLVMRSLASATPVGVTGTTTFTNVTTGAVQYVPTPADTANPGLYMGNWVVTFNGGSKMTFPTVGYLSISVEENLTTPGGQQLVSLPDVKDYLNVPENNRVHDAKLIRWINAVTPLIENIAGPILVRTFDEWHSGGQYFIQLRRRPSFAIGMNPVLTLGACEEYRGPTRYPLSIVGDPTQATTYSCMLEPRTATVYRRTTGGSVIPFGASPFGGGMPDAVHVVYQAGQATVPPNVYEAALEALRVNYETTMGSGRGSRTRADELETGPPLGFYLPRRCLELLSPLRRHSAFA